MNFEDCCIGFPDFSQGLIVKSLKLFNPFCFSFLIARHLLFRSINLHTLNLLLFFLIYADLTNGNTTENTFSIIYLHFFSPTYLIC